MMKLLLNNQPLAGENPAATITEWQAVEFACTPPPGYALALSIGGMLATTTLHPFQHPGDPDWRWTWNPHNTTGQVRLALTATHPDGSHATQHYTLNVAPRTIDQQHYTLLLDDLQRILPAVLSTLSGHATGAILAPSPVGSIPRQQSLLETYCAFFDERFATLEQAMAQIARAPHTHAIPETAHISPEQAYDLSRLGHDLAHSPPTRAGDHILPQYMSQSCPRPSPDTYENRLLKRLLHELWQRATTLESWANQHATTDEARSTMADRLAGITRRLRQWQTLPFLEGVGSLTATHGATHTMRHHLAYRHIYRLWQDLRRLPWLVPAASQVHIPISNVPQLYEYWCAIHLMQALLALPDTTIESHHLPTAPPFRLLENTPLLEMTWHSATLRLRYQPRYQPNPTRTDTLASLDSHTHIPDLVLELLPPHYPPRLLIFDAKYRLDQRRGEPPQDALADAYTYLGSIGLFGVPRVVLVSALLYPGTTVPTHHASGISTIPLLPGATDPLYQWLHTLLAEVCGL
jgi:hypothetical protein